jgi:hypothetical protein
MPRDENEIHGKYLKSEWLMSRDANEIEGKYLNFD